jgi:hypothetical protein
MAINANKAKRTVDFEYTEKGFEVKVRFHHTTDFGPSISIVDTDREWDDADVNVFPAKMFGEIADFLRQENLIGGGQQNKMMENELVLPLPQVENDTGNEVSKNTRKSIIESGQVEPLDVKGDPFESFNSKEENTPVKPFVPQEKIAQEEISEEEAKKMWEERKKAAERAKTNTIKRTDKSEKKEE